MMPFLISETDMLIKLCTKVSSKCYHEFFLVFVILLKLGEEYKKF
jgi:hypothetical protein